VGRRAIGAAGGDACYGSGLTLRTELSLVLSSLLAVSIGLAGGTAIYQSARNMRRELTTEHQLFAENRAFALRDNFEILEDELKRLALLPQMDMGDGDSMPEQLTLAGAHEHSVLYNTAVLLLDDRGLCLRAVPDRPEFRLNRYFAAPTSLAWGAPSRSSSPFTGAPGSWGRWSG
jgi:hypothetical protein